MEWTGLSTEDTTAPWEPCVFISEVGLKREAVLLQAAEQDWVLYTDKHGCRVCRVQWDRGDWFVDLCEDSFCRGAVVKGASIAEKRAMVDIFGSLYQPSHVVSRGGLCQPLSLKLMKSVTWLCPWQ